MQEIRLIVFRMTIINTAFIVFLALKNTPLAFVTAYSYERLNLLHQVGGYTTITFAVLHVITVCLGFEKMHFPAILLEMRQIDGIIAVVALFVLLVFALLLRRIRYEVFYISHILMFMLYIITAALHQPEMKGRVVIITMLSAAMWGSDRILRGLRILWYAYDNHATVTPLPHGGTRILLQRSPSRAVPGTHCFLWIPKVRAIETHPFTIVSKTPCSLELVVAAYDGFTHDLHNYAVKYPGATLRASFDGPYGALPNFAEVADKMILIAGGSGASFTFGVALDVIRNLKPSSKTTIEFIWTVREQGISSHISTPVITSILLVKANYKQKPSPGSKKSFLNSRPLTASALHCMRPGQHPSTMDFRPSPKSTMRKPLNSTLPSHFLLHSIINDPRILRKMILIKLLNDTSSMHGALPAL